MANTDYTKAIEISAKYSEMLKKIVDEYNNEMKNEYDNYVSHCFTPFSPQFFTDKPSDGFEPWFNCFFRKDIGNAYICESTTIETGITK